MEALDELARLALEYDQKIEELLIRISSVTMEDLAESLRGDYELLLIKRATIESKITASVADYFQHDEVGFTTDAADEKVQTSVSTVDVTPPADTAVAATEELRDDEAARIERGTVPFADNLLEALRSLLPADVIADITGKIDKLRIKIPVDMSQRRCVTQFASALGLQLRLGDDVVNAAGAIVCEVPLVMCDDVIRFAKKE